MVSLGLEEHLWDQGAQLALRPEQPPDQGPSIRACPLARPVQQSHLRSPSQECAECYGPGAEAWTWKQPDSHGRPSPAGSRGPSELHFGSSQCQTGAGNLKTFQPRVKCLTRCRQPGAESVQGGQRHFLSWRRPEHGPVSAGPGLSEQPRRRAVRSACIPSLSLLVRLSRGPAPALQLGLGDQSRAQETQCCVCTGSEPPPPLDWQPQSHLLLLS
ncbi:uncharacterized protein LOC117795623 [Ailuropoda melanoleuca]|uniref:uncharacterized protein LOC117795623 n=1 Tax=Ailuropoda melanoleuca TaxID=9646 RepID=UPI001493E033|nr:uncharacterized protein LOC117795623 [Ailuropoda melanoleuca]